MTPIMRRFGALRLGTKFSLFLVVALVLGVALSTVVLRRVILDQTEENVTNQGEELLGIINAVRSFTSTQVGPLLASQSAEPDFVPAQVPAFAARQTFEALLRQDEHYAHFAFKEASPNPMNLVNQADDFELDLIARFERNPALGEVSGFRSRADGRWFYIARPLTVKDETCLACHGDPADAPTALIAQYGDQNGFGWEVGHIIAAQVIYVPAEDVFDKARSSLILMLGIFIAVSVGIVALINFRLKPMVIRPVAQIAGVAEMITEGSLDAPACASQDLGDVAQRGDELGQLARVFQNMCKEIYAREEQLRAQVQQLRIEIDHMKRDEQVAEITETHYFQELQTKAQDLRRRRRPPTEL
jgi:hypothetical protein